MVAESVGSLGVCCSIMIKVCTGNVCRMLSAECALEGVPKASTGSVECGDLEETESRVWCKQWVPTTKKSVH
jgi:hypothetical protein